MSLETPSTPALPAAQQGRYPLPPTALSTRPDRSPPPLAAVPARQDGDPQPVTGVPTKLTGQLVRFAAIGVASTLAYLGLYALLRLGASPQWANFGALLSTAIANTAANRRLTFGVRGTAGAWRHQAQGLLVFAVGLGLTSGALALLDAVAERPARPVELAALILANLLATAARFLMLRSWVFRSRSESKPFPPGATASPSRPDATASLRCPAAGQP